MDNGPWTWVYAKTETAGAGPISVVPRRWSQGIRAVCVFGILLTCVVIARGQTIRVEVARDTWVSSYDGERDANLGGAGKLKTKGIQDFTLLDMDVTPLRGRVVTGATLNLYPRSKDRPLRLTVSAIATDWIEGTSNRYRKQPGSASFNWAAQDQRPWAFGGSDITAVINGLGNAIWRFADASPPGPDGYQTVAVDPVVVAARVAGISHGFVVFDDVGHEYTRTGDRFQHRQFPNRFSASRHAGRGKAPFFTVHLGPTDRQAPPPTPSKRYRLIYLTCPQVRSVSAG